MTDFGSFVTEHGLVPRSQSELLDFPTSFRWEFSRRHPYYMLLWRRAAQYKRHELGPDPDEIVDGYCAMCLLGMLGIHGEPADPAIEFLELGEPTLGSGSVQPMTFRSMVQALIAALPPAELCAVGATLITAGDKEYAIPDDEVQGLQRERAHVALLSLPSQALDSYPSCPLFYIHLNASQRQIVDDIEVQVRAWKEARNIPERRIQKCKYDEYLRVWDAREGWNNGAYNVNREHTFAQIAKQMRLPRSTVASRYYAAFRHIVGNGFDHVTWIRVMGLVKLRSPDDLARSALTTRYRQLLSCKNRRPVPESVVAPLSDNHCNGLIECESAVRGEQNETELWLDIIDLIQRGLSDRAIKEKLELSSEFGLPYIRHRLVEFGEDQATRSTKENS